MEYSSPTLETNFPGATAYLASLCGNCYWTRDWCDGMQRAGPHNPDPGPCCKSCTHATERDTT